MAGAVERDGMLFEWDVGIHYIGKLSEQGAPLRVVFDHLTGGELEWADMGDGYDTVVLGDERYPFPRGKEALRDMLVARFPAEARGIDRYFACVAAVMRRSPLFFAEKAIPSRWSRAFGPALRYPFLRYARRSTADVISECVADPRLQTTASVPSVAAIVAPSALVAMLAMAWDNRANGRLTPMRGSHRNIRPSVVPATATWPLSDPAMADT